MGKMDSRKVDFMQALREHLPEIKDSTLATYGAMLVLLYTTVCGKDAPFTGFSFIQDKKDELIATLKSGRFSQASLGNYYSVLMHGAKILKDKNLEAEFRQLKSEDDSKTKEERKKQGERMKGTRAAVWPTFSDLVHNKVILDRLVAMNGALPRFPMREWRLLQAMQLVYSFIVNNAFIMTPRFQVFFNTNIHLWSQERVWPPTDFDKADDTNHLYIHEFSPKALLVMNEHKTNKTRGQSIVELSPQFATEALLNLKAFPRSNFFGDPKPSQKTADNYLKKTWLWNDKSKLLNFMDIRSTVASAFMILTEKYTERDAYARNSMTSVHCLELDYQRIGLPAYTKMKEDLLSNRSGDGSIVLDLMKCNSLTDFYYKQGHL